MQNKVLSVKEKLSTTEFFRKSSQHIIELYKSKQFAKLNNINKQLFPEEIQTKPVDDNKKLFYSLIKIFHPDSYKSHLKCFNDAINNNDTNIMEFYFRLISIQSGSRKNNLLDFTFRNDEIYKFEEEENESYIFDNYELNEEEADKSIISIISQMFLGNSGKFLEPIDLSQIDGELILSKLNISDLDGIQYCTGVTSLDLSLNKIDNIYEINSLWQLEELDLSDNDIDKIDYLAELNNLVTLYLDFNQIDDISVLLKLEKLEFVSITNNPLTNMDIIYNLKRNGVIVIYY